MIEMTRRAFTIEEVRAMEEQILQVLHFELTFPTPLSFLELYIQELDRVQQVDLPTEFYTKFILESSLRSLQIQRFKPSVLALSSLILAWRRMD